MKYTAAQHEKYLNELFSDIHTLDSALRQFDYLATPGAIAGAYASGKLGSLMRRNDSIAFHVTRNERAVRSAR